MKLRTDVQYVTPEGRLTQAGWQALQGALDALAPAPPPTALVVADFDAAAIVTAAETIAANDVDTALPTAAAVKSYVDASIPSAPTTADVLAAIAGATAGDVGTYAFARRTTGTADVAFGATLAGSSLSPTSAMQNIDSNNNGADLGAALSGTWQCMGTYDHSIPPSGAGGSSRGVTLWLRVA